MKAEFDLVQAKAAESSQNARDFKHAATEIEEQYLEKLKDETLDTNILVHSYLRQHAIDVLVRCNEQKRSYQNLIWED